MPLALCLHGLISVYVDTNMRHNMNCLLMSTISHVPIQRIHIYNICILFIVWQGPHFRGRRRRTGHKKDLK